MNTGMNGKETGLIPYYEYSFGDPRQLVWED